MFRLDEDHRYWLGDCQIPGVTEVMNHFGLGFTGPPAPEAALRGTYVHLALLHYATGRLDRANLDPAIAGYVESGIRFWESLEVVAHKLEGPSYDKELRYGYTLDGIGCSTLGNIIWDYKTGKASKYVGVQLSAYLGAEEKRTVRGRYKRIVVELDEHGAAPNLVFPDKRASHGSDYADWCALLRVYRIQTGV